MCSSNFTLYADHHKTTLQETIKQAAALLQTGAAVTIELADGIHTVSEPIVLRNCTERQLHIVAAEHARPVISGR